MKKVLLIIALFLTVSGMAQESEKIRVARLAVKTAIEAEEKAKFETYFKEVTPDTLDLKKSVLIMAKDNGKTYFYLKSGNKNYIIDSFDCNVTIEGVIYNIRSEGDTIKLYGDKGVILYTIQ